MRLHLNTFSNLNSMIELDGNGVHTVRLQIPERRNSGCLMTANNCRYVIHPNLLVRITGISRSVSGMRAWKSQELHHLRRNFSTTSRL